MGRLRPAAGPGYCLIVRHDYLHLHLHLHGLELAWFREVERRSLAAARLKHAKSTPDTEAVEIRDHMLHKPFNVVETADWTRAGVAEAYAITPVVSIEEPHAPSVNVNVNLNKV